MTRTELFNEERREAILALTIAVAHESTVADLEADQEFRSLEMISITPEQIRTHSRRRDNFSQRARLKVQPSRVQILRCCGDSVIVHVLPGTRTPGYFGGPPRRQKTSGSMVSA
jgi:hypothetical protein